MLRRLVLAKIKRQDATRPGGATYLARVVQDAGGIDYLIAPVERAFCDPGDIPIAPRKSPQPGKDIFTVELLGRVVGIFRRES